MQSLISNTSVRRMSSPSLTVQLITISILTLQREFIHLRVSQRNQWNNTYDYIVIGSGSAGSVVAARLSEDPSVSVLLLEAGVPDSVITDIPSFGLASNGRTFTGTEYDWGYYFAPQKRAAQAFVNHQFPQLRGRVLGGTSSINSLFYNRGNRRDFDNWARRYGAIGWSYEEVLPYFLRSENNTDPRIVRENARYHATDGPLSISSVRNPDRILVTLQQVAKENGIPVVDFNGPTQLGQSLVQETVTVEAVRSSTSNAFLLPIKDRTNLNIVTRAYATKILFNNSDDYYRATSVQFVRNGSNYSVNARREIIVSGGAINSPQLLMLSGIGPRNHLLKFNIPVIVDLPVGNNLMDHVEIAIYSNVFNSSLVNPLPDLTVQNLYECYVNHSGILSEIPTQLIYFNSRLNDNYEWPDILNHFLVLATNTNVTDIIRLLGDQQGWRSYWNHHVEQQFLSSSTILARARSRGTVRLNSSDPFTPPIIDPNYFDNPYDFEVLMDGMRQAYNLLVETSMSQFVEPFPEPIPGCRPCGSRSPYDCEEYVRCYIRQLSSTYNHVVGTCRMGSLNSTNAVVDERLRVIGVSGLRVIDGSIMPEIINGNLNAATIMIGEYGAQMIKDDNS